MTRIPLSLPVRAAVVVGLAAAPLLAAPPPGYHGRKAWILQNPVMKVTVTPGGGHIASMVLLSGRGAKLNPLWLPPWKSVEPGAWEKSPDAWGGKPAAALLSNILGHNLCLDFFGAPSREETAAGIPVHGEAPCVNWVAGRKAADELVCAARLPRAQMRVERTITLNPSESGIWISETVENLSAFDRPFGWQQHVTFGPPFLQVGASRFDMPAGWCQVYPKEFSKGERLKRGAEFQWPNAPAAKGKKIDLRAYPAGKSNSDFTTCQIDLSRQWGWLTAVNTKKGLLIGYVWPRKEWPWVGNWEENRFRDQKPWLKKAVARGMEFGTTPFPDSRREMVTLSKLHGVPTYRWIAAKQKQTVAYGAFLASLPAGATGVKDVQVVGKKATIQLTGVTETVTVSMGK